MERIDFDLKTEEFFAVCLNGTLEDYSSEALHVHPFHQVLVIRNGVALLEDGLNVQPQFGHLAAFIPAGAPHRTTVFGEAVEYQSLYFNSRLMPDHGGEIILYEMSGLGIALLERLNGYEQLSGLHEGLARECVLLLVRLLGEEPREKRSQWHMRLPHHEVNKKIVAYLEQNYMHRIHAEDVARVSARCYRQASRLFTSEMKLSIFEYLRMLRMLKASIMLKTGGTKIVTIAYDCGYESLSAFFADFKGVFGISPGEFRRR